jgi:septum formation protein
MENQYTFDADGSSVKYPASDLTPMTELVLASSSPRRQQLLRERGLDFRVIEPGIHEGLLERGQATPAQWVMALAYIKARSVVQLLHDGNRQTQYLVIGADTLCVDQGQTLGKPSSPTEAKEMLARFVNCEHEVVTGVAIVCSQTGRRDLFIETVPVRWGFVSSEVIDAYVASGAWQGKAGGYNLSERLAAGWPIEAMGDPATVMGLPVDRVIDRLSSFGLELSAGA